MKKRLPLLFVLPLLFLATVVITLPVQAEKAPTGTTYSITVDEDEINNDGDCTLREAIHAANTDSPVDACPAGNGADLIILQSGMGYNITNAGDDNSNLLGDFDITDNLMFGVGNQAHAQISAGNLDRIFDVRNGAVLSMTHIDLTNGKSGNGGAIAVTDGRLWLRNSFVRNNTASFNGGALYSTGLGEIDVDFVTFEDNTATFAGGAIYAQAQLEVTASVFRDNVAGALGGGLGVRSGWPITLDQLTLENNSAETGGGISLVTSSDVTLKNSVLEGNSATANGGGLAIVNGEGSSWETYVYNTQFLTNSATLSGGGIYAEYGELTVQSLYSGADACAGTFDYCTDFRGNSADNPNRNGGGGIYVITSSLSIDAAAFRHNTVDSGTSIDYGTALWLGNSEVSLTNALISNHDDEGVFLVDGTTFNSEHVTYANNNQPLATVLSQSAGNVIDFRRNIIWGNTFPGYIGFASITHVCNNVQTASSPWGHPTNEVEDPLFVNPASENYRLQTGSPAIDQCAQGLPIDLDGNNRPAGSFYDRGAFENGADVPTAVTLKTASLDVANYHWMLALVGTLTLVTMARKEKFWKLFFSTLILLFIAIPQIEAAPLVNRFVSTTGTNDGDCTVLVSPCRDIAHALSVASANDTIQIFGGTYNETLVIDQSMILRGFGSCDRCVVLQPASSSDNVITVQSAVATIEDFDISGGKRGVFVSGGTANILKSAIHNNSSDGGGGGVYVTGGSVTLNESSVYLNETINSSGGGVYLANSIGTVVHSTIRNNHAKLETSGGGIYMLGSSQLNMENSTVSGNSAEADGGGIFSTGTTELFNVTITNNHANVDGDVQTGDGGGIYHNSGSVELRNTIVAGNIDNTFGGGDTHLPDCRGTLTSMTHNLIGLGNCNIIGDTTGNITTPTLPAIDPMLDGLADNGGETLTHALQDGSPAIDAGRSPNCIGIGNLIIDDDQRGEMRPAGGRCDMGAYEKQLPPTAVVLQNAKIQTDFQLPVWVLMSVAILLVFSQRVLLSKYLKWAKTCKSCSLRRNLWCYTAFLHDNLLISAENRLDLF